MKRPSIALLPFLALGALLPLSACGDARKEAAESTSEAPGVDIDQRPSLVNREDVVAAARDLYPEELRRLGVGGVVNVGIHVGIDGRPMATVIYDGSGLAALDTAAVHVARRMEFTPGMLDGAPVPVWVQIPVTFQP